MAPPENQVQGSAVRLIDRGYELDSLAKAPPARVTKQFGEGLVALAGTRVLGLAKQPGGDLCPAWVEGGALRQAPVQVAVDSLPALTRGGRALWVLAGKGRELVEVPLDGGAPRLLLDTGRERVGPAVELAEGWGALAGGLTSGPGLTLLAPAAGGLEAAAYVGFEDAVELSPALGGRVLLVSDAMKRVSVLGFKAGRLKVLADYAHEAFVVRSLDETGRVFWWPDGPYLWCPEAGYELAGLEQAWEEAFGARAEAYPDAGP